MCIIPTLGTIGLILIVFEGGLELEYHTDKNHIIRNALVVSIVGLLATALGIAGIFAYFTGETYYRCLLNAIPYSVMSPPLRFHPPQVWEQKARVLLRLKALSLYLELYFIIMLWFTPPFHWVFFSIWVLSSLQ